jgi:hypothetical protein
MSLIDEIREPEPARRDRPQHPQGWEPGIAWNGRHGTITSRPLAEPGPDWTALITTWGFDPATVEIVEPVQVRTWDAAIGDGQVRTMWYYRAGLRQRRAGGPDVAELIAEIRRHRSTKRPVPQGVERAFVYAAADWQIGKRGTDATVGRVLASYDAAASRIRDLRRIGRSIDSIYFLGLGDLIEGCKDHYAMQEFEVELDKRSQVRTARRLWIKGVETLAPLVSRMVCAGVGGNHGEERREGKAYTTFGDNADVEVVESAAEVLSAGPAYAHVSHVIPNESLTLTLDIAGTITGLAHGHQARRGPTPQAKVKEWWKGQMFGMRPVGDATLLLTGHNHHLSLLVDGPRTHIQAPTMDSGSQWWEESAGVPSVPAGLSLTVGPDGWDDLKLL